MPNRRLKLRENKPVLKRIGRRRLLSRIMNQQRAEDTLAVTKSLNHKTARLFDAFDLHRKLEARAGGL